MSTTNVFDRFRDYFQAIADSFEDKKIASKIFPNSVDKGLTREDIFMEFLKQHLPKRCEVAKGGFIFDQFGHESKQIDILITHDNAIQFKQFSDSLGGKSFSFIEGCLGAISIKSRLDEKEIHDALSNIASIPPMPKLKINPALTNTWVIDDLPFTTVFAFDGVDLETAAKHIDNYYLKNEVPDNRKPDFIIVNNKWIIVRIGKEAGFTESGSTIPPYSFYPMKDMPYNGAYSLLMFLLEFQKRANLVPHILYDFSHYAEGALKSFRP